MLCYTVLEIRKISTM